MRWPGGDGNSPGCKLVDGFPYGWLGLPIAPGGLVLERVARAAKARRAVGKLILAAEIDIFNCWGCSELVQFKACILVASTASKLHASYCFVAVLKLDWKRPSRKTGKDAMISSVLKCLCLTDAGDIAGV